MHIPIRIASVLWHITTGCSSYGGTENVTDSMGMNNLVLKQSYYYTWIKNQVWMK